jgi:hypothetical protein
MIMQPITSPAMFVEAVEQVRTKGHRARCPPRLGLKKASVFR